MAECSEVWIETSLHNVHPDSIKKEKVRNDKAREKGLKKSR